ncbi:DUF6414 family protein [Zobellia galactanivorans]|uniref:DUF6414 family protein n=1 Tax=Zobellia galactanivorans (strain DSM 12802 / CCUG 47099 / CIP 106680 / NCIMB 13871 / Dsij) TaxID=63186 RepID=UPI001C07B829|nr:hypothetical protein [Zobellia galactanivorans]MBU3027584.1 hypothetical protein [Zobellia galactanivorans]
MSKEKKMKKLRSFVYLDNYKMYSISSQLFEGLTEYIVKTNNEKKTEEESQKGPLGSGRLLADIIEKDTNQTEKKFLHDYSYNLFEDTLKAENRVLEIDLDNINENIEKINEFSFVKVSGNVVFNDLKIIEDTIRNFNDIGGAFGYITQKAAHDEEVKKLKETVKDVTDRNQKAKINSIIKSKTNFKKQLKESGLNLEEDYIKNLAYILDYGYNQQFEVQIPIRAEDDSYHLFSAQLKRENLKDDEYSIIKKYSRESEKKFVLFGILTQTLTSKEKEGIFSELKAKADDSDDVIMKEALMNVVSQLTSLEKTFTGKLDYEFVIDPISLYIEI